MFKKLETYLKNKQEQLKKQEELRKAQTYYKFVKAGQVFIQFLQEDMKRTNGEMNRHQRRRMEHDLKDKGILSEEIVQYYGQKIDYILANVSQRLNPPKIQSNPNVQVAKEKPTDAK